MAIRLSEVREKLRESRRDSKRLLERVNERESVREIVRVSICLRKIGRKEERGAKKKNKSVIDAASV